MHDCPECGTKTRVIDTRPCDNETIRYRWCSKCCKGFYTHENLIDTREAEYKLHIYRQTERKGRKKDGTET